MSVCEKCGKTYYTRECLKCRDTKNIHYKTNTDDFIHIKKINIQYIIAGALITIALIMIYKEYKEYRQEKEIEKIIKPYGETLNEMNKATLNMMKQINQGFKYKPQK